jgi:hypothetical protein
MHNQGIFFVYFRDVHGGAQAAVFFEIHCGSGAAATAFFSKTLKKCMNLIEL